MGYSVKELFLTLQGEGLNAGRAAVFLRFSGCNLWTGREADRTKGSGGCARWCDTDFVGTDGPGGGRFDSPESLAQAVLSAWGRRPGPRLVVCTGGEPLLQLDAEAVTALHALGFEVAVETNGTRPIPAGVDWVCVSPKAGAPIVVTAGDELKLVYPQPDMPPDTFGGLSFRYRLLQPMDGPHKAENTRLAVAYCLEHPEWRLGLQTHKLLGIP